jgi:hypothetical protein
LLSAAYVCKGCGKDYCVDCYERLRQLDGHAEGSIMSKADKRLVSCKFHQPHSTDQLFPITLWSVDKLSRLITEMEAHLALHPFTPVDRKATLAEPELVRLRNAPTEESNSFMEIDCAELDEPLFHRAWSTGETLVVHNVLDRFKLQWTPSYFMANHGTERCRVLDCQSLNGDSIDLSVREFFSSFDCERDDSILKLKVGQKLFSFKVVGDCVF